LVLFDRPPYASSRRPIVPAVTDDPEDIWTRIAAELRQAVPADMYDIWLAPLELVERDGDTVVVSAPAELRGWIADRFARVLQAAAAAVIGPQATVDVLAGDVRRERPSASATRGRRPAGEAQSAETPEPDTLNPKYTFDQFVIGDANRFAHAAALTVAELPGQAYNPLYITGTPGVGKTHLLHAIGNYARTHDPTLTVRYTTIETFTNQFVAALTGGSVERFKGRFRHNDVLLVDDVQAIAAKARTEEELFHTFDALHQAGAQIVLTSDRMPGDLEAVQERLRERFGAGLVTAIAPPDLPTRLTVLRKRVQLDGVELADEGVLDLLAERVPTNMRALEGALIRIVAFASLTGRVLDRPLAQTVLDDLYPVTVHTPGTGPGPTIERIQELTAEAFGLTAQELVSPARAARVAWPRQVAMYLAREHTGSTLPAIGRRFGGRNHTTVLHACRRTTERLASDPEARAVVAQLAGRLSDSGRDG
jgi:chromosomal replication initiator protein